MISFLPRRHTSRALALTALALAIAAGGFHQPVAAQTTGPAEQRFDITGNDVVNSADLADGLERWRDLAAATPDVTAVDLNGDGVTDVADLQLLAANVGRGTTEAAEAALNNAINAAPLQAGQELPVRTFTVNSSLSGDPNRAGIADANRGDGICATTTGVCTLQAAVQETNAPRSQPYRARIAFDVKNTDGSCPAIVRILPNLDFGAWLQIDDSSGYGTIIDGYTQCGASPNTGDVEGNAVIKVEIVGTKFGAKGEEYWSRRDVNGIEVKSANNVIRGLALYNWDQQLQLSGPAVLYNQIQGNFIGTNASNTFISKPDETHHREGVRIQVFASYNVIGCGEYGADGSFQPCTDRAAANAARNIVAGNGNDGIHIEGSRVPTSSRFNRIAGNYIGLAQDGRVRRATSNGPSISKNQADGVDFEAGANNNWLGGETEFERNFIAGNVSDGIEISHDSRTRDNRVVNNYFGIDAHGNPAGNGNTGISVEDRANNTLIYRNVVGSNAEAGIRGYIFANDNQIYENWIGVMPDGTARGNRGEGVYLMGGSQRNMVRNNVIAHNLDRGVEISTDSDQSKGFFGETYFNTISRNTIYNNAREGIKHDNRSNTNAPIGNQALARPRIVAAGTSLVVGDSCAGCKVEIFIADKNQLPEPGGENSGEGRTFVGEGIANGAGQFAVTVSGVNVGQLVTATNTDGLGNTSEFARNLRVVAGPIAELTPVPTFTATATSTPSPTATSTPEPTSTTEPTATPTSTPTVTPTLRPGESPLRFRVFLPSLKR